MNPLTQSEASQLNTLALRLAEIYKEKIDEAGAVATGELKNFQTTIALGEEHFMIYFNLQDYWKWVERGRRPGKQPPTSAIEHWIEVKHLVPNPMNNKIPSTQQLAFLIARKIGREGYEGRYPLKNTMESPQALTIINEIKTVLIKKIKDEINAILIGQDIR